LLKARLARLYERNYLDINQQKLPHITFGQRPAISASLGYSICIGSLNR
jgi:hypothetical protein